MCLWMVPHWCNPSTTVTSKKVDSFKTWTSNYCFNAQTYTRLHHRYNIYASASNDLQCWYHYILHAKAQPFVAGQAILVCLITNTVLERPILGSLVKHIVPSLVLCSQFQTFNMCKMFITFCTRSIYLWVTLFGSTLLTAASLIGIRGMFSLPVSHSL